MNYIASIENSALSTSAIIYLTSIGACRIIGLNAHSNPRRRYLRCAFVRHDLHDRAKAKAMEMIMHTLSQVRLKGRPLGVLLILHIEPSTVSQLWANRNVWKTPAVLFDDFTLQLRPALICHFLTPTFAVGPSCMKPCRPKTPHNRSTPSSLGGWPWTISISLVESTACQLYRLASMYSHHSFER